MKVYAYDKKRYFASIILPNVILMGCLVIFSLYDNFFISRGFNLLSLVLLVAIYTLFNTVGALAYPREIVDTGEAWEFHAFGRKHVYFKSEITAFHIRDLSNSRIYLRVNTSKLFQGRYWIKLKLYSDGAALSKHFHELEYQLHPEDLKFNKRPPRAEKAET